MLLFPIFYQPFDTLQLSSLNRLYPRIQPFADHTAPKTRHTLCPVGKSNLSKPFHSRISYLSSLIPLFAPFEGEKMQHQLTTSIVNPAIVAFLQVGAY
jgi:hypothetical protein